MNERLPLPSWMTQPQARAVIAALEHEGGAGCARFVGGCVRDTLLGLDRPEMDVDIATRLTPPDVTRALRQAGLKAIPTGIEHGTVTAVAPDADGHGRPFEITTLRRDVETDGRRAVVAFSQDWAEDAARRDFRLNALYMAPDGVLHDPTGEGLADARAGRIVFVGDPETRIREDYLRVLRFFRFRAWYGRDEPDAAAVHACGRLRQGLAGLSGERVSKELLKLLAAPDPRPAVALMGSTGVLDIVLSQARDLSRFDALIGLASSGGVHSDAGLRLAALLPDRREAAAEAAGRLRASRVLRDRLLAVCPDGVALSGEMTGAQAHAAIYRLGGGVFADRMKLAWAAAPDPTAAWRDLLAIAETWTPPPFPVSGADIKAAGVAEGPRVGRIHRAIEDWWIASDFSHERSAAMTYLHELTSASPDLGAPSFSRP